VLAGSVAVVALMLGAEERIRVWCAVLVGLTLHLPWLPIMARQPPQSLAWMEGAAGRAPAWKLWLLPLAQSSPAANHSPWLDLAGLPLAVEVLALSAWAWLLVRGLGERRARRLVALWAAATAALIAVNLLARPVYLPGRTEVLTLAMVVVVAAVGAGPRPAARLAAATLAACGLAATSLSLAGWARTPPGPEREIARLLGTAASPGDTVVTTGWWWLGIRHALGERVDELEWRTFPVDTRLHPGWYDDAAAAATVGAEADALLRSAPAGRVWLVRTPGLASDRELDRVVTGLGLVPVARSPAWSLWGPAAGAERPPPGR
jgi:hypothetical protein